MPSFWPEERIIKLIELIKIHPHLWNPTDKFYRSRTKRAKTFDQIAEELGGNVDRDDIERKWKVLQAQFRRECRKTQTDNVFISRWFGYEHLLFLKKSLTFKGMRDPLEGTPDIRGEPSTEGSLNGSTKNDAPKKHRKQSFPAAFPENETRSFVEKLTEPETSKPRRDCCDVYGEHVANKLRTYDAFQRIEVEHKINCILYEADMELHNQ